MDIFLSTIPAIHCCIVEFVGSGIECKTRCIRPSAPLSHSVRRPRRPKQSPRRQNANAIQSQPARQRPSATVHQHGVPARRLSRFGYCRTVNAVICAARRASWRYAATRRRFARSWLRPRLRQAGERHASRHHTNGLDDR